MKPYLLALSAFGPYPGKAELDFSELKERKLFLIHGPTGAGKTSILDAICYALYGDTSGNERRAQEMRSHHAHSETVTEVCFEFGLGQSRYKVTRSPQQGRPKNRGSGIIQEPAKATLWMASNSDSKTFAWRVMETQPAKVTGTIEKLLGFQSEQFRQVVILPQGQFRKLLMADSKERQGILDALFRTEFYQQIELALKERAKAITEQLRDTRREKEVLLQQADVASVEELEDKQQFTASRLTDVREQLEQARKHESRLQAEHLKAQKLQARLEDLEQARNKLANLQQKLAETESDERRIENARRASLLEPIEANLVQRETEKLKAERYLRAVSSESSEAEKALVDCKLGLEKEQNRQAERDSLKIEISNLDGISKKVGELSQVRAESAKAQQQLQGSKEQAVSTERKLSTAKEQLAALESQLAQLKEVSATLAAHNAELKLAENINNNINELIQEKQKLSKAQKALKDSEKEVDEAEKTLGQWKEELRLLETQWHQAQAAILARKLSPGAPCPVCGSPKHPFPAKPTNEIPTDEEIEEARREISEWEDLRKKAAKENTAAVAAYATIEARIKSLEKVLGKDKSIDPAAALSRVTTLKSSLKRASKAAVDAEGSETQIAALQKDIQMQEKAKDLALVRVNDATALEAKSRAILEGKEAEIPEDLRDEKALSSRMKRLRNQLDGLEKSLQESLKAKEMAQERATKATADQKTASQGLENARNALKEATETFEARLNEFRFTDRNHYLESKVETRHLQAMEKATKEFRVQLEAASKRILELEKNTGEIVLPDLDAIKLQLEVAKTAAETLLKEEAECLTIMKDVHKLLTKFASLNKQIAEFDAKYLIAGRISEVANGDNALKVTFQRFVLGALLDDVLAAASERLKLMSKGRYLLQRALERTDLRKTGGLDLEVFDAYTGTTRSAATLSGGESFLASLSLALGLADVVQAYTGGVYLDTIFVDEGFGSLDSDALDLALRALMDLQQGGRLVGIISHVPELRERIDARLEVHHGPQGSQTRFVVP